ncbi:uracil-DNA glycosylase [Polynucleobacter sp. HIN6]|uniref:uracil-DNA glycosylase n=1 Tax=Polynucleobacter sp. HIN6 TaxID=3047865 RepID=UPI002573EDA4|nr:uracil-DNA glycosylase [Polynucleobacter sp. HIN6]BEI34606.1 uracil-DNA glycosylase [Polynucleobacter sp. HIN6]
MDLKQFIPDDWQFLLNDYLQSSDWHSLSKKFAIEYQQHGDAIRPDRERIFNALHLTPVNQVKVVILGQDPYHSPGLAQGLAFSVPKDIQLQSKQFPSSLRNINKALMLEGLGSLSNGDLTHWAKQGVLLLNTALSVRLSEANSHAQLGWKPFVIEIIQKLSQQPNIVWMLWGGHAQSMEEYIHNPNEHLILKSSHPSGLGVYKTEQPFIYPGDQKSCGHFTKANAYLITHQKSPIAWTKFGQQEFKLSSHGQ